MNRREKLPIILMLLLFVAAGVGAGIVVFADRHVTVTHEGQGLVEPEGDFTTNLYRGIELELHPDEGWHVGYILVDGNPTDYDDSYRVPLDFLDFSHKHIHVVFVKDSEVGHTLTVTSEGMGSVTPGGVTEHNEGSVVKVLAIPLEGYVVGAFIVDGRDMGPLESYDVLMDGPHSIHVVFIVYSGKYTLTIHIEGKGATDPPATTDYESGSTVTVHFIPEDGWTIGSVIVDGIPVGSPDSYTVIMDRDHSMEVGFIQLERFSLGVTWDGEGMVIPNGMSEHYLGEVVRITSIPDDGWMLSEFLVDGEPLSPHSVMEVTMDKDRHVHVVFTEIPVGSHALVIGTEGRGTTNPSGTTLHEKGVSVSVTALPSDGWMVSDVIIDGVSIGATGSFNILMDRDHVVSVVFIEIPVMMHTLVVEVHGNGDVSPSGESSYEVGTNVNISAVPSNGWELKDIVVDGVSKGAVSPLTVVMDSDHTVVVEFAEIPRYLLSVSLEGSGSTEPFGVTSYPRGTEVTIHATPVLGWTVSDFRVDGESKGAVSQYTLIMNGPHSVVVVFTQDMKLTVTHNNGGTVVPDGETYHIKGASVALTVTSDSGYIIGSIHVDGEETGSGYGGTYTMDILMDRAHVVEVTFVKVHVIDVTAGDGGSIRPSGNVSVVDGDDLTLVMTPDEGWRVLYAVLDEGESGEELITDNPFTLRNVTSDHTVRAVFERISGNLTHITVDTSAVDSVYSVGDHFDRTGLVVRAHYDDGTSHVVTDYDVSPTVFTSNGVTDVTVTYNGKTAVFQVSVQPVNGVDVFVTEHNGSPVTGDKPLSGFVFNTSNLSPGDVRTLSLRIQAEDAEALEAFVKLAGLRGDMELARYIQIGISSEGVVLGSATLFDMWGGRTIGLGILPSDGVDVTISVTFLDNDDPGLMSTGLVFNLEAGAGRSIS